MEPVARIATADSVDIVELAAVAARTFPLACPPSVAPEDIAAFVEANLSELRFIEYLADPQRLILTANQDDRIVGYAMLIRGGGGPFACADKTCTAPDEYCVIQTGGVGSWIGRGQILTFR